MYVEISGRQSGKTTRLIKHMANKILDENPTRLYLIIPRISNVRFYKELLVEELTNTMINRYEYYAGIEAYRALKTLSH